jgi:hypothetical protein
MRTRAGKESVKHRGDEASWSDGLDSVDGGGTGDGSITEAPLFSLGTGRAGREREDAFGEKTWFNPVDEISDCPGGVCPVPWATKEEPPVIQEDVVNHPSHYTDGGIECIEAIEAQLTPEEYRGYIKGNIAKYLWRERLKGGVTSLKKAQWYLDRLVQFDEAQNG